MERRDTTMQFDPSQMKFYQPSLFEHGSTTTGMAEFFPEIWGVAEGLTRPDVGERRKAITFLAESGVSRISPLIVYLLATRLNDSDLGVRTLVVKILGDVLAKDVDGNPAPEIVRQNLSYYLSQMRTRQIYAILQVLIENPDLLPQAARLLNACPYAGNHLSDVLNSRKVPLDIRRKAIQLIGYVGYLDTLPALERMLTRLESRLNGQQAMPFAPQTAVEETELIPDIQETLLILRSP